MAKINDGGPAFPVVQECYGCEGRGSDRSGMCEKCDGVGHLVTGGMSLRDWFAGLAMSHIGDNLRQANRSGEERGLPWSSWAADEASAACYEMADAMIAQHSKEAGS